MKTITHVCIAFFITLSVSVVVAFADTAEKGIMVVSMGAGAVENQDDTVTAKKQAVNEGLVSAVELAVIQMMPEDILISGFPEISQIIHTNTRAYIKRYKVLAEDQHKDTYRVVMESEVLLTEIRKKLTQAGIVSSASKKPRVLCLVTEYNLEDIAPQYWWGKDMAYIKTITDDTLTKTLKQKGFEVIGHQQVTASGTVLGQQPEPGQSVQAGADLGADFVVTGKAVAERSANSMGSSRTYKAAVDLAVYRTDTGEKVAAVSDNAVVVNEDEIAGSRQALAETSAKVGNLMSPILLKALNEAKESASMFEVVIEGENFFFNYIKLSEALRQIPEITRLQQQEKRVDRAVLVVDYKGTTRQLAQTLLEKTFEDFGITISQVTRRKMTIEIVPL